jgi:hypothetical protein
MDTLDRFNFGERLQELDRLANSPDTLGNLDLMDFAYCYKVREVYNAYKENSMTLEECKEAKEGVKKEYLKISNNILDGFATYCNYQDNLKSSELLRAEVNQSNDPTEMLPKCLEIISLLTGDETFLTCNLRKLGG